MTTTPCPTCGHDQPEFWTTHCLSCGYDQPEGSCTTDSCRDSLQAIILETIGTVSGLVEEATFLPGSDAPERVEQVGGWQARLGYYERMVPVLVEAGELRSLLARVVGLGATVDTLLAGVTA